MPEIQPSSAVTVVQQIPLDQIRPSRHQARKSFDDESLKSLAESIRQEGLLQPVTVRPVADGFELISGERRFRAVRLLGQTTIEAKVLQPVSEGESAAKGLIENLQRENLTFLEEAQGFQDLLNLKDSHWNQEQIAKTIGKSPTYISQSLRLLKLPAPVLEKFWAQNFSRSHGIELLRLQDEKQQIDAINAIESRKLSWEATRKLVDGMLKNKASDSQSAAQTAEHSPFKFTRKGINVLMSATFPMADDLDKFLGDLRTAYRAWQTSQLGERHLVPIPPGAIRIPKTPEEEAEMMALATGSPGPEVLYAWIYGKDNPVTLSVAGQPWANLNPSDPKKFVKKLLERMRS
jgi:ParB family chromosome partitioning protein